jgi:hypothetical protein
MRRNRKVAALKGIKLVALLINDTYSWDVKIYNFLESESLNKYIDLTFSSSVDQ